MRVVSWNMHSGFGSRARHDRAWHYLRALDPDVALLQEASPPAWADQDWKVFYEPAYPTKGWGSGVLVKEGIHCWALEPPKELRMPRFEGSPVVLVEVVVAMEKLIIGSIHASSEQLKSEQVLELVNHGADLEGLRFGSLQGIWPLYVIFNRLSALLPQSRFIVGGDLNAARLMDISSSLPRGNIEFFDSIESSGFHSAVSKFNEGEPQTYFKKDKKPYQLDHLYCDQETFGRLTNCAIIDHPVTALDLSDHAPIVADFE